MFSSSQFLENLLSWATFSFQPIPTIEESSPYQIQYKKNYQLIRNKYKSGILGFISFSEVSRVSFYLESNIRSLLLKNNQAVIIFL